MKDGFHTVPGYPWGFSEKILAGSLDEKGKVGNRTRILKIEPGAYSTVPFVHEYWDEVFLVSERPGLHGSDDKGKGGESFTGPTYVRATRCPSRPVHLEEWLPAAGDALLRCRSGAADAALGLQATWESLRDGPRRLCRRRADR